MHDIEKELSLRRAIFKKETDSSIKICVHPPISVETKLKSSNLGENAGESSFASTFAEKETKSSEWKPYAKHLKIFGLVLIWFICSFALMANNEMVQDMHQISVPKEQTNSYIIYKKPKDNKMRIMLEGAFLPSYYRNLSMDWLSVWVQLLVVKELPESTSKITSSNIVLLQNISDVWYVPLVSEKLIGVVPEVDYQKTFHLISFKVDNTSFNLFRIQFSTSLKANLPLLMGYNLQPINPENGIVYAALVLCVLYVLIIFEVIHRTLAAMLASTMSVAILAVLNARPTMSEIISWMDIDTLLLLFSMMTLVTIFSETGIFDYMAVWAYKFTGGKIWPLINTLCVIVTILTSFLDNVTTILLITPVTIKLCEAMKIDPARVLMIILLFANIGGAITPIGDPPNVIIASNPDVKRSGVSFSTFTLHMGIGALLSLFVVYIQIRLVYRDTSYFKSPEPIEVTDLKREIAVWQRTAATLSSYSKDEEAVKESLIKKTAKLQVMLKVTKSNSSPTHQEKYSINLRDLEKKNPIRNKVLLIKSGITLLLVISVLFLHSIPALSKLGMGWTSLLGALLLLLLYDNEDIEGIFARVEWSTLLFFASLFILMEALTKLGLIDYIGKQTQYVIMSVGPDARLAVAIILILWVSAIASAFVDNLPLTTMMVKVAVNLVKHNDLNLPLQPLIWALSYGSCLGGNGSLFGSSSNIICAGLAEQHGYKFSFTDYLRVGVPVAISSLTVTTIYLIVCHVVWSWH